MSEERNKIVSAIFSKTTLTVIFFLAGVGAYVWGFVSEDDSLKKEILIKLGDVLVIGVVIGFIANAAQFLKIYKEELQKIIFGKEFVGKLKDVTNAWETISKQMFKNKFPKIHQDFLKVMKLYFPQNEVSYYNEYESHIKIEWNDEVKRIIKVTETIRFELIAASEGKFDYPLKTWTRVLDGKIYENKITSFTVDNVPKKLPDAKSKMEADNKCEEHSIELKGKTNYEINYTREKVYDLTDDHYIGFRAKYIVKDLRVNFECPDDIDAQFVCRGTQNDFTDAIPAKSNKMEKKYKGIILPRQGYIFALQKK